MAAVQRKEIERRRRRHLKDLCAMLASLIPEQHCPSSAMEKMNQFDILDAAVSYIMELKQMVEQLEQHRRSLAAQLMAKAGAGGASTLLAATSHGVGSSEEAPNEEMAAAAPVVAARLHPLDESIMDVVLIGGVQRPLMMHEVIAVLEEEGAEVLNANLTVVAGRQIFCSVHSQAISSRIGMNVSRVTERLRALI